MKSFLHLPLFFLMMSSAFGESKSSVPRFVSLRPNEVNVRVGPGPNYPVEWIYLKSGFPVEVIAEFDTWRKIRDFEGTEGWVHQSMLSKKRHARIQDEEVIMYREADDQSAPLVRLQKGVILDLLKSRGEWCQVQIFDFKGWIPKSSLWGIYPQEKVG